ncbi:MAG: alginate lyase family protein, partial [Planctomycetes bacterium]|nr:alginate lyase family protein [Planctomycetota bacterium]
KNSPVLTNDFLIKFYKSLLSHGRHIMNNLEYGPLNSNHYLSDLVGLVYLGILFPEFKEAKKWRNFGIKELIKEMKKQVHSDGVDYEASTSYHRLVTELFLSATLLCQKNGIEFPSWYLKRLEKMIEYIIYYTTPNGSAPVLGDNDNGRLQKLETQEINDHKSLCSTGAVLFNRADFKNTAGKFYEESFWLLGETGLNKFNTLKAPTDNLSSKPFSSGGSYIMRKNNLYMIIDGGDSGMKGTGGHGHNDLLSFELYAYDKTFIVDPGSYVYTPYPEERFYFKSTQAHNTVVVDDKEIARFNGFWGLKNDAQPKIHKWKNTEQYDFFDAEHSGYQRLTPPVIHRRQVYFNKIKSYWVIKDILNGKGKHKLNLYFHLTPLKSIRNPKNKLMVYTQADQGANLAIIPLETENLTLEIMEGWISPGYGVKTKAPVIKYIKETTLPAQLITILAPYREQYFSMDLLINIKEEINEFYGSIL